MSDDRDLYAAKCCDAEGTWTEGRFKKKEDCDAFTKDKVIVFVSLLTPICRYDLIVALNGEAQ